MTEADTPGAEVLTASGNHGSFTGTVATLSTAKAAGSDFSLLKGVVNTGATPAIVFTLDGNGKVTQNGELVISDGSQSTTSSEGALQVTGGAGIGKNLFVGGTMNAAGITSVTAGTGSTGTGNGALVVTD